MKKKKTKLETVLIPNAKEITKMQEQGISEKNIAERLGISYTTWKNYKKALKQHLQNNNTEIDEVKIKEVEAAMYEAAIGISKRVQKAMKVKEILYENGKRIKEEERIKYYYEDVYIPPSVSAGQFLLKNWDKDNYSNNPAELKQKIEEFEHKKTLEEW